MKQYHDLLQVVLEKGEWIEGRNSKVLKLFNPAITTKQYDLSLGFPLATTKKVFWKGIVAELLWFLSGSTNARPLIMENVNFWNDNAYDHYVKTTKGRPKPDGGTYTPLSKDKWLAFVKESKYNQWASDLGPVYGKQWRHFGGLNHPGDGVDQLKDVIENIKKDPTSRRHIVSAWNPVDLPKMALPPCHILFQFSVTNGRLDLHLTQRSGDAFLGIPFNIASYSLLLMMVAQVTNLTPGSFFHTINDLHIYEDHLEAVGEQLKRDPYKYRLPTVQLNSEIKDIEDFTMNDIELIGYNSYPTIKAKMIV